MSTSTPETLSFICTEAAAAYQDAVRQAKADSINAALITANNEIRNPLLPLK